MTSSDSIESAILKKLEIIHKSGVSLYMDGNSATPKEIAEKCLKEEMLYMPDYVIDETGTLQEVRYDKVYYK